MSNQETLPPKRKPKSWRSWCWCMLRMGHCWHGISALLPVAGKGHGSFGDDVDYVAAYQCCRCDLVGWWRPWCGI